MKTVATRVVSVVLLLSLVFAFTGCGDLFTTVDYPSIDNLKQALEMNGNPAGKTCRVTVEKTIPNAAQGFIARQGTFNFCFSSDPGVKPGDKIIVKITGYTRQTDAIYVNCQKA